MQKNAGPSKDAINALRNRCVLPVLEKIDAADGTV
jgi:hypothetical protein